MPALFVLAAMAFSKISPPKLGEPPLELHPWLYTPKKGDAHLNTFFRLDKYRVFQQLLTISSQF
jgi:hypothetical protein